MNTLEKQWTEIHKNQKEAAVAALEKVPYTSLNVISHLALNAHSPIIEASGAASNFARELIKDGYKDVSVLEPSTTAIEERKEDLGEMSSQIKWIAADPLNFNENRKYKLWHDRAVFHFLTAPADIQKYVQTAASHIEMEGYLILSAAARSGPEKYSGLPVSRYTADELADIFPAFRVVRTFEEPHVGPSNHRQTFIFMLFKRIS